MLSSHCSNVVVDVIKKESYSQKQATVHIMNKASSIMENGTAEHRNSAQVSLNALIDLRILCSCGNTGPI